MKALVATLALLISSNARADIQADVTLLRSLAPVGSDVANIQNNILLGDSPTEALAAAQSNYAIQDFNSDGIKDVLVIFEQNPQLQDDNGKACPKEDYETGCRILFGDRILQFFLGSANGGFTKVSENSAIMLRADEGGVYGDPLNGLSVKKNGTVGLSFYGGSAWRWSYDYTLQFRSNDLYLIGTDTMSGWNGDGRFEAVSINLLTGTRIDSWSKSADSKTHYKTTKIAKQPLKSLSEIE